MIKIFEAKDSKANPYRLIEVITKDYSIKKKIPISQIDCLFLSNLSPKAISVALDENGINTYAINGLKVICVKESIIYIKNDKVDNTSFNEVELI